MKDNVPAKPSSMSVQPQDDGEPRKPVIHPTKDPDKDVSVRTDRERAFKNQMDLSALVQDPRIASRQTNALEKAYDLLWRAQLIDSKSQFAAGVLQMIKTPISIAEAAGICGCSRQWFRNLEIRGRLTILRNTDRKTYITSEDIIKILEGTI